MVLLIFCIKLFKNQLITLTFLLLRLFIFIIFVIFENILNDFIHSGWVNLLLLFIILTFLIYLNILIKCVFLSWALPNFYFYIGFYFIVKNNEISDFLNFIFILVNNFYFTVIGVLWILFIYFHSKCKNWSCSQIRDKTNLAVKLFTNVFANTKSESNSLFIQIFIILNSSKHLKKL